MFVDAVLICGRVNEEKLPELNERNVWPFEPFPLSVLLERAAGAGRVLKFDLESRARHVCNRRDAGGERIAAKCTPSSLHAVRRARTSPKAFSPLLSLSH